MQLSLLKKSCLSILCFSLISIMTGCQCTSLTDVYSDKIDDISDHGFCMDCYYSPCWDLSRIGHSDWKACKMNRSLCEKCGHQSCEEECSHCDTCTQKH